MEVFVGLIIGYLLGMAILGYGATSIAIPSLFRQRSAAIAGRVIHAIVGIPSVVGLPVWIYAEFKHETSDVIVWSGCIGFAASLLLAIAIGDWLRRIVRVVPEAANAE